MNIELGTSNRCVVNENTVIFRIPIRLSILIVGLCLTASTCFSQDTLKIVPRWKLASCELEHGANHTLDTLYPGYNPETDYLELVLIEHYSLEASSTLTKCRLQSLEELLESNGLDIAALTPKIYYGHQTDLQKLGKKGLLRTTYLVIHRR
jgi:hypothetical protein